MSVLSDILRGINDRRLTPVATPEWPELDGKIHAVKFSAAEKIAFWDASRTRKITGGAPFLALMVACGAADADGGLIFTPDDYEWIAGKDAVAVGRIAEAVDSLNILSDAAAGSLEKNSERPATSAGTLPSPAASVESSSAPTDSTNTSATN